MQAVLLLFFLVTVSSKNIPSTVYLPTKEQLLQIFGEQPLNQTKTETVLDKPATDMCTNYTERPLERDSNVRDEPAHPATVELNIKIVVGTGCEGVAINETVQVHKSTNSTGDGAGAKKVKEDAGKGAVKINSRVDDRVALAGDACPTGKVRFGAGGPCVKIDI